MGNKKHTLTWHTYPDHLRGIMRDMMRSEDFADVTLVTNDKKALKAHRNILSACSPVFKDILQMSIQSNHPMIYLNGIQYSEIESILQFMYLGEAKFYEERMNEFFCAVKDLKIKELSEVVNSSGQGHDHTRKEATEEVKVCINESTETFAIDDDKIIGDKAEIVGSYNGMLQTPEDKQIFSSKYQCKLCDKTCSTSSSLWHHNKNKHEGFKFACNLCDYQATQQRNLTVHIQSKHEGIKYACNQCDYQATSLVSLTRHIQSKHEVKYACNQCDYQAGYQSDLTRHIQSKHEGVKFVCNQCDYQATTQKQRISNLNMKVSSMFVISVTIKQHSRII